MKLVNALVGVSLIGALAGTAYLSYTIGYHDGRIGAFLEIIKGYEQELDDARKESQQILKLPDSVRL